MKEFWDRREAQVRNGEPGQRGNAPLPSMTGGKNMRLNVARTSVWASTAWAIVFGLAFSHALAQGSDAGSKVDQLKAAIAKNQQQLAAYTWQTEQTISVNGDVKSSELFQVIMGPNGQPTKVPLTATPSPSGRKFGVRHRMTEDYETYGKQIAALAQSYAQPAPGKLQQLYAEGNVSVKSGGAPGILAIVVTNYVKAGDSVTITFNQAQKAVAGINVATYNSSPSDVVTMTVGFAKLPSGVGHVSSVTINGQSKNMVITQQNENYQLRQPPP